MAITTGPINRSPKRRTRDSIVEGDLAPPYSVQRSFHRWSDGLVHAMALIEGAEDFVSCCAQRFSGAKRMNEEGNVATCFQCTLCRGCPACRDNYIIEATMYLGKWETKDKRRLYPFEMDDTHLLNALRKIQRDQEDFKPNWRDWVKVLGAEVNQRRL